MTVYWNLSIIETVNAVSSFLLQVLTSCFGTNISILKIFDRYATIKSIFPGFLNIQKSKPIKTGV
jgi:hypothetical protein